MQELTMELDGKSRTPLYEQIYEFIKSELQAGTIQYKEKLPSARALAAHLAVSRSTVDLAYEQLRSEGYIEAVPCKGYFACQLEGVFRLDENPGIRQREDCDPRKDYLYDFTPNGVDLERFPFNIWRKINRQVLSEEHTDLFLLGDPQGEAGLREAIARYLHQARGVNCTPEQIVIGAGNDYLLMLLSRILGTKRQVAMEDPTYRQAYCVFENLGYSMCAVEMDAMGMMVEELEKTEADLAYVMPSHQYPMGIVMPIGRRYQLLQWAAQRENRYIIEDDYDSEFRYKGKPIPALQGYDRKGKVIYLGTFSKSIAPAIRISYMVLPPALCRLYERTAMLFSSTVSRIDQRTLEVFIREGHFERHLNRMRTAYKGKHDLLVEHLKELKAVCSISGEQAGVHLLARFEDGRTEKELIDAAREHRIKVYGLSENIVRHHEREDAGSQPAGIILGYAALSEEQICRATDILNAAWL
ncbi:MocR-like pyridoxine biosynthesis transcription factor PdxR [Diplocloster modestus]|uniref:PLP-dependent aminotransferase family protein n=1 Tax=Diplocloster modestus TaxID=2850322 RepID=A0ABS6KEJ7_9FIRM|nr:PLP-dependent aminotransferase family protein [Diplocloster modestus]MBU9728929.1 PLP-dependent aminotransferase family protein [Diplocloster modestus]